MLKPYVGSCHCGAVRFEATLDLSAPTYRCNCSICARTRFWPAIVTPDRFRVTAGEAELTEYRFNARHNAHYFCKQCGVRPFGIGHLPTGGKIVGVNLGCLEGVPPEELAAAPIVYIDGKNDKHEAPPITSYL